tara:strand:- start:22 stop:1149 length:1128 start_codon:yes stop_codon:yes gene_type:complete
MLNLDSIRVDVREVNISNMITGVTIYESIFGFLQGAIAIKDGINFFDNFIGTDLAPVNFSYEYLNQTYKCSFYMDGISDMKIQPNQKNYIMHLKSIHNPVFAERINDVYNGTTDQIIKKIFTNISHEDAVINIDSIADTKGRYVAPNITARDAFTTLTNSAYDVNNTGMFLYERFVDANKIRLTSLFDMLDTSFVDASNTRVSIKNTLLNMDTALELSSVLGTSSNYELREYNMNFIRKLEDGIWGEAIDEISLSETKKKSHITKEATSVPKTKFKLSDKLYSNDVKSIFSTEGGVANSVIRNHKIRTFNTTLEVSKMVALPNLGVGMSIHVELGEGNVSHSSQAGEYLVKHIQHNFTINGGEYGYTQDIGLVRA